jgi:hypothetical protein
LSLPAQLVAVVGILLSIATSPPHEPIWVVSDEVALGDMELFEGDVLALDLVVDVKRKLARKANALTLSLHVLGENHSLESGRLVLYWLNEPFDEELPPEAEPMTTAEFRGGIGEQPEAVSVQLTLTSEPQEQHFHLALMLEGDAALWAELTSVASVSLSEDPETSDGITLEVL